MRTHISKWGNSLAVRLPRKIAEQAGLDEGRRIELELIDGALRITLAKPNYTLAELLTGVSDTNIPDILELAPRGVERL
jgi:antitoxin MazE